MANAEIAPMLESVGFVYDPNAIQENPASGGFKIYPNPSSNGLVNISINLKKAGQVNFIIADLSGRIINKLQFEVMLPGLTNLPYNTASLKPGLYTITFMNQAGETGTEKLLIRPEN